MYVTGCKKASDLVAYTARVSNPTNQSNTETAPKLLKYLIKEEHWSPFEMVHMTMEIKTTRDIARQILRHRSFSFQEFSQRYAVSENFQTRNVLGYKIRRTDRTVSKLITKFARTELLLQRVDCQKHGT